jgi:hypothetical protein
MAGDRILHLGIIKKENEVLASESKEVSLSWHLNDRTTSHFIKTYLIIELLNLT